MSDDERRGDYSRGFTHEGLLTSEVLARRLVVENRVDEQGPLFSRFRLKLPRVADVIVQKSMDAGILFNPPLIPVNRSISQRCMPLIMLYSESIGGTDAAARCHDHDRGYACINSFTHASSNTEKNDRQRNDHPPHSHPPSSCRA